jgi:hypothetical protein
LPEFVPSLFWDEALVRLAVAAVRRSSEQAHLAADRIAGLAGVSRLPWIP